MNLIVCDAIQNYSELNTHTHTHRCRSAQGFTQGRMNLLASIYSNDSQKNDLIHGSNNDIICIRSSVHWRWMFKFFSFSVLFLFFSFTFAFEKWQVYFFSLFFCSKTSNWNLSRQKILHYFRFQRCVLYFLLVGSKGKTFISTVVVISFENENNNGHRFNTNLLWFGSISIYRYV